MPGYDSAAFSYPEVGATAGGLQSGYRMLRRSRQIEITAFSRPASRLARLGGPLTTLAQDPMTERYLRALA